ncbi:MAG: ATP-binding protein [Lachnospiraceae bacterium]|nr:ATP-binding protein [Lachnospiraceae bacterium]
MTIKDIMSGESKNIEFKVALPEKSIKYMKSVVAFANCSGGKILFGIEDGTCKVVGIDDEDVFKTIDAITNAISDSCEPAIYPDILLQTIEEKTIIVVEISAGKQRPYYIKSMGKENGVFVRVAGTSRPADEYMMKELLFEGSNRSFDQTICLGLDITDDDIAKLCSSMKRTALKNCRNDEERAAVKDVTVNQLISWGIVLERDGKYAPTNAFALLSGNGILPTATQCGMFKGTTKANFIDRREYTGSIQEQVEEALQFVLRNIHMGAEFSGLSRQDIYEIPVESIRELLLNAAIHRSYLDHTNIQVAIYDDRLEVTSPGKLPMGQSIERMKKGYSKIRNEAIAYAFSYMKLMEHWGSGIPRIIDRVVAAGLREPEFIDGDVDLRVNIYRRRNGDNVTKNVTIDTNEAKLIAMITRNPTITQAKLAKELGVTTRTVKRILSKLQEEKIVRREGNNRSGRWIIVGKQEQ